MSHAQAKSANLHPVHAWPVPETVPMPVPVPQRSAAWPYTLQVQVASSIRHTLNSSRKPHFFKQRCWINFCCAHKEGSFWVDDL